MGDQRRLNTCVCAAAVLLCAGACGGDRASEIEERRAVLRPPDDVRIREERRADARITDEHGALLPSEQVVAGVALPRGFSPALTLDRAWYYRSRSATFEQVDRYFLKRLDSREIRRSDREVEFVTARPKGTPGATPVLVRVRNAPEDPTEREIYIELPRPSPSVRPTEAEVRAQIEARRKFAD
jgi:hypothetical protein